MPKLPHQSNSYGLGHFSFDPFFIRTTTLSTPGCDFYLDPFSSRFISLRHSDPRRCVMSITPARVVTQMPTIVMTQPFPTASSHGIVAKVAANATTLRQRLLMATPEAARPGRNSVSMVVDMEMSKKLAKPMKSVDVSLRKSARNDVAISRREAYHERPVQSKVRGPAIPHHHSGVENERQPGVLPQPVLWEVHKTTI